MIDELEMESLLGLSNFFVDFHHLRGESIERAFEIVDFSKEGRVPLFDIIFLIFEHFEFPFDVFDEDGVDFFLFEFSLFDLVFDIEEPFIEWLNELLLGGFHE